MIYGIEKAGCVSTGEHKKALTTMSAFFEREPPPYLIYGIEKTGCVSTGEHKKSAHNDERIF